MRVSLSVQHTSGCYLTRARGKTQQFSLTRYFILDATFSPLVKGRRQCIHNTHAAFYDIHVLHTHTHAVQALVPITDLIPQSRRFKAFKERHLTEDDRRTAHEKKSIVCNQQKKRTRVRFVDQHTYCICRSSSCRRSDQLSHPSSLR